ncbi:hypothetical protein M3Y97_00171500 [Aphelenchoides bicaudatus]|nr:hypothetical protein M3Y97_00171500 [Aphelenchoides bicaudatus]
MRWSQAIFVAAFLLVESISATDECQKLAICALDHCIPSKIGYPSEKKLIQNLLENVNFGCVMGPACYDQCSKCASCTYAQEQVKRMLLHQKTSGRCKKLEACAQSCLDDKVQEPFSCVFKTRCIHHCLDKDGCQPSYDIVKRVFTGFCFRNDFMEHYGKKCRPLFDELAEDLVNSRH